MAPYPQAFTDMDNPESVLSLRAAEVLFTSLLIVLCVNVAILVYARTATRHGEIAVRSALGASRRRIVGQLFMEALVLSGLAAGVGLGSCHLFSGSSTLPSCEIAGQLPFWLTFGLSSSAVVYARAHRCRRSDRGHGARAESHRTPDAGAAPESLVWGGGEHAAWPDVDSVDRGAGRRRRGAAAGCRFQCLGHDSRRTCQSGYRGQRISDGAADVDRDFISRYADRHVEVMRRLTNEPGVSDVTFAMAVPGEEPTVWVEVEGVPMPAATESEGSGFAVRSGTFGHEARFNRVGADFFDAFDVPVLMGRAFTAADARGLSDAVIVNRSFAERIAGAGTVLGRRVRYVGRSGDARPSTWSWGVGTRLSAW